MPTEIVTRAEAIAKVLKQHLIKLQKLMLFVKVVGWREAIRNRHVSIRDVERLKDWMREKNERGDY